MKISNFFKIQQELTNQIIVDESLSTYKLLARKHLQLHIKMSDLANETKCSTYWLNDESTMDKITAFDKYIACLRQIISLALEDDNKIIDEINFEPSEYCLSDQFLALYIDINDLIISPSTDHYMTLLSDFLSLSISLGFTEKMITDGFYDYNINVQMAL
jgi:dimeric dUTPase (all-alpha-NTP-PPase superfamily)